MQFEIGPLKKAVVESEGVEEGVKKVWERKSVKKSKCLKKNRGSPARNIDLDLWQGSPLLGVTILSQPS